MKKGISMIIFIATIFGCNKQKATPKKQFEGTVFIANGVYDSADQKQLFNIIDIFADSSILKIETDSLIGERAWGRLNIEKKNIDTIRFNVINY